jgi:hypothetical protein
MNTVVHRSFWPGVPWSTIWLSLARAAIVALTALAVTLGRAPQTIAGDAGKTFRCRLVNVTIPADSPLRNSTEINHPPVLYVLVKKNGVQLAQYSSQHQGWSVDFPKDNPSNQWEISEGADDRYAIELWDSNWGPDDLALSITGLNEQDFRGTIYEQGPKGMSKDRLVTVAFAIVKSPASK